MSKLFRAILIDPEDRTIDVVVTPANLKTYHSLIKADGLDNMRIADHERTFDYAWVDDMGLARGKPIYAFKFSNRKDPVAGRCLLIGVEKATGRTTDAEFPLDVLRENIEWLGLILPEVTEDTVGNKTTLIVTYSRVRA